jgi:hypothetical protein
MQDIKFCDRHGGPWGSDETCPQCTTEDGTMRGDITAPDTTDFGYAGSQVVPVARLRELVGNVTGYVLAIHASNADGDIAELTALVNGLLCRPVPNVTRNTGKVVRAVIDGPPRERGSLKGWWVACEDPETGDWCTWACYAQDGSMTGRLSYDAGHYFTSPDRAENKRRALADLAVRAGLMRGVAVRIADEVVRWQTPPYSLLTNEAREDRRMARRLRKWATG